MKKAEPKSILPALPAPSLKSGDDKIAAKELARRYTDAQNGMRRIIALGLLAWEIKESRLKHGQFGPWLAAHAPKLCRVDADTGKAKPSASLSSYMALTAGVLETVGLTVEKYLGQVSNSQPMGICKGGAFMIVAEKKVPKELLELREKIFAVIDGKTAKQLFLEFKQAEEDEDGSLKAKHGRLKGKGGATAAQRAAAKAALAAAEITAMELWVDEVSESITEQADDAHWGRISDGKAEALLESFQLATDYLKRLIESRKAAKEGK